MAIRGAHYEFNYLYRLDELHPCGVQEVVPLSRDIFAKKYRSREPTADEVQRMMDSFDTMNLRDRTRKTLQLASHWPVMLYRLRLAQNARLLELQHDARNAARRVAARERRAAETEEQRAARCAARVAARLN